ncbi:hypothetical protein [Pseudomonas nicosulfuronedens]
MLKLSRNLVSLTLLVVSALASAESKCQRAEKLSGIVRQEVSGPFGVVCITSEGESAALKFLAKGGEGEWVSNSLMVAGKELDSGVVSLTASNTVDLVFEYPRDMYVVSFDVVKGVVLSARHVLRVPSVSPDEAVAEIELRAKQEVLKKMSLGTAQKSKLFDKDALELSRSQVVRVSSRKAELVKVPMGKLTGMYLVKGDKVKLVKYEDGWVQLEYVTAAGHRIKMWTALSNIL